MGQRKTGVASAMRMSSQCEHTKKTIEQTWITGDIFWYKDQVRTLLEGDAITG
jgi:hypothetical protein